MNRSLFRVACFVVVGFLLVACNVIQLRSLETGNVVLMIDEHLASAIRNTPHNGSRSATGGAEYQIEVIISGDHSAQMKKLVASNTLQGTSFVFEDVPPGISIQVELQVHSGDTLLWYGKSRNHYVTTGVNTLSIPVECVTGVVGATGKRNFKIYPYGKYDTPLREYDLGSTTSGADCTVQGVPCFDAAGNVYLFHNISAFSTTHEEIHIDYGPGMRVQKSLRTYDGNYGEFQTLVAWLPINTRNLAVDKATNKLYVLGYDSGDDSGIFMLDLNDTTKDLSSSGESYANLGGLSSIPINFFPMEVYNDVLYIVEQSIMPDDEEKRIITSYSLQYEGSDKGFSCVQKATCDFTNLISLPFDRKTVSDIQYQDGAIYLCIGSLNSVDSSQNGGIVKFDAKTLQMDTNFGDKGVLGLSSLNGDSAQNNSYYFSSIPYFTGFMPNKLVVSDDTVSKLVTIDLETEAVHVADVTP
ncbi:MAG: hypothetical protein J6V57_03390 [Spirochaetaceae bacterium]|nr:hypothetical protein [Spirochaetaceae bacterium]